MTKLTRSNGHHLCLCGGNCSLFVWLYHMSTEAKQMCCNCDGQAAPRPGTKRRKTKPKNVYHDAKAVKLSTEMLLHLSSLDVDTK